MENSRSVVIFGAGEAGRRALSMLRAQGPVEVVAFADNAPQRHGSTIHGYPVIAARELADYRYDRIVVASHGWRQILPQLVELGVRADRIDLFRHVDDTIHPAAIHAASLPRILLVTDECISLGHGTGALLLRQFAGYPPDCLLHAFLSPRGDAALPHSHLVAAAGARPEPRADRPMHAKELVSLLDAMHGGVDLVYSNVFGDVGLAFLAELADAVGPKVPIVHHALDFLVNDEERFDSLLRALSPRLDRIWAIGPSLADRLASATRSMVTVVNPFCGSVPPTWKTEHRNLDERFTAVIVGNVYTPAVFVRLKTIWADLQRRHGVGPIRWFAHPTTVQRFEQTGVVASPEIEYCGFAVGNFLHEQLCAADMALLPFNLEDQPDDRDPFGRFSVPSRLTEYMMAGLPVFAAAGSSTDAYRFMAGNRVAVCSTLADGTRFAEELAAFMRDTVLRREIGASARRHAVEHCDVEQYRVRLLGEFAHLLAVRGSTAVFENVPIAAVA